MNAVILFEHDHQTVSVTHQAKALAERALSGAALIAAVRNQAENAKAAEAMKGLATVIRSAESARKALKEPVIDLGRAIDNAAKTFCQELQSEMTRLQTLCGDWQQQELEKARAAERARQEELARIERERQEEQRKLERDRLKAESEALAIQDAELRKAKEAEAKAAAEALELSRARQQAEVEAVAPVQAQVKVEGQTVKPDWEWDVVDLWTLARMHPGLVEITPRKREIREVIEAQAHSGAAPKIAGLRIREVVKVGVRTGRLPQTINV